MEPYQPGQDPLWALMGLGQDFYFLRLSVLANMNYFLRLRFLFSARPATRRHPLLYLPLTLTVAASCCSGDEIAVCTDIALELLKWSFMSSNDVIIDAVRASKTFRSVNTRLFV